MADGQEYLRPKPYWQEDGDDGESTSPARNRDPELLQAAREIAVLKRQVQEVGARLARAGNLDGSPEVRDRYRVENVPTGTEPRFLPPTDPYGDD